LVPRCFGGTAKKEDPFAPIFRAEIWWAHVSLLNFVPGEDGQPVPTGFSPKSSRVTPYPAHFRPDFYRETHISPDFRAEIYPGAALPDQFFAKIQPRMRSPVKIGPFLRSVTRFPAVFLAKIWRARVPGSFLAQK
jgi:hypothetical protein